MTDGTGFDTTLTKILICIGGNLKTCFNKEEKLFKKFY